MAASVMQGGGPEAPTALFLKTPESVMPDPTHLYAPKTATEPTQICEKCRNPYTLDHFQHGIEGQDCVCRRCLQVMGYQV